MLTHHTFFSEYEIYFCFTLAIKRRASVTVLVSQNFRSTIPIGYCLEATTKKQVFRDVGKLSRASTGPKQLRKDA